MILLTGTTEILRLVTGAAADIDVYVSYVDAPIPATPSSNVTPGKQIVAGIVTAATTTICAAPLANVARNVKNVNVTNNHASASCQIEVEFFDGTNVIELRGVTLLAGENVTLDSEGEWHHHDIQGAEYTYTSPPNQNLGGAGVIAETMPRETCPENNTTVGASGVLYIMAIKLRAGDLVSAVDLWSATTAAGSPTNYAVGLYDAGRNLVANSANKLTEAWAATSLKSFTMVTPYRVPTTGLYYIGFYMTATTVVTLKGGVTKTGGQLAAATPALHGNGSAGLTTTLPNPAIAPSTSTGTIYAAVR